MPAPAVEEILDHAVRQVNAGQLERARQLCEHALAAHPPHAGVHQLLAVLELRQGRAAEALAHARASLALRPDHLPTLRIAADAALAAHDPGAACRLLERTAALAPADPDAWFRLSLARHDAHDLDGAATALRELLRLDPSRAEAHVNLGVVLQDAGRLDEAIDAYAHAYRLRTETFGRIAHALAAPRSGRLYLDLDDLRRELAARALTPCVDTPCGTPRARP